MLTKKQPLPTFWNKLESAAANVITSDIGPNLTNSSGTFVAAYFGNGLKCTGTQVATAPSWRALFTNKYEFTVEFWVYFDTWGITNGVVSAGTRYDAFQGINPSTGEYGYWGFTFRNTGCSFFYYDGQVVRGGSNLSAAVTLPTTITIPVGSKVHFAYTYKFTGGLAYSNLYVDGTLVATGPPVAHVDGINYVSGSDGPLYIGNDRINSGPFGNVIDNVKIYSYAKFDFSDRFIEAPYSFYASALPYAKLNSIWKIAKEIYSKVVSTWRRTYLRPTLWNTLGSATEITSSIIGNNGVGTGTITYGACKFGNGAILSTNAKITFSNPLLSWSKPGCVEFWMKTGTLPITPNNQYASICMRAPSVAGWNLWITTSTNLLSFSAIAQETQDFFSGVNVGGAALTSNTLYHIAFTWDYTNTVDGTNYLKFYVNGINTYSSSARQYTYTYPFGNEIVLGHPTVSYSLPATFDNVKIYDEVKTDFSDIWYVDGNVLYPDLKFWSKFNSVADVDNPTIGYPLNKVGTPTYAATKFGNGITSVRSTSNYAWARMEHMFPNSLGYGKGSITLEWWSKVNFTYSNGVASGGNQYGFFMAPHANSPYPMSNQANNSWSGLVVVKNNGAAEALDFYAQLSMEGVAYLTQTLDTYVNFAANDIVHIAVTYNDTDHILRLYINGILHSHSSALPSNAWAVNRGVTTTGQYIGCNWLTHDGGGTIDNLKIYYYAKTDFSDRFNEDGSKSLVFWNKLESGLASSVGPALLSEGVVTYQSAKYGDGAYVNNGGSIYKNSSIIPSNGWTIEWWFKDTSGTSDIRRWFTTTTGSVSSGTRDIIFRENGSNQMWFWTNNVGTIVSYPAATYKDGNFHHYAITYDATSATAKAYIDGILVITNTSVTNPVIWKEHVRLGGYNGSLDSEGSIGIFDNLKVYNYPKTDFSDRLQE